MARAARSARPTAPQEWVPPPEPHITNQATNVMAILDVVGALGAGTLADSLFLFDNNHRAGSAGHGTSSLSTVAQTGDVVVWTTLALECEAFARLERVEIDDVYAGYLELDAAVFTGTPEVYWFAKILEPLPEGGVPYRLSYRLGSARAPFRTPIESRLMAPHGTIFPRPPEQTEDIVSDRNEGDVT